MEAPKDSSPTEPAPTEAAPTPPAPKDPQEIPVADPVSSPVAVPAAIEADEAEEEDAEEPCLVCGQAPDGLVTLICDGCDHSVHLRCAKLRRVPKGDWFCDGCAVAGYSPVPSCCYLSCTCKPGV